MKRNILYNLLLLPLVMLIATWGMSQTTLAEDQNPNYMVSQEKYTGMADSINSLHGTTPQETYKAIDWMADKREARDQRRAFRRELRMERAKNGWYYSDYSSYYPGYSRGYYPRYSRSSYYPGYSRSYYPYYQPYHNYRSGWNRSAWSLVPLAATVGWLLTR